jgi:hypothetical protein
MVSTLGPDTRHGDSQISPGTNFRISLRTRSDRTPVLIGPIVAREGQQRQTRKLRIRPSRGYLADARFPLDSDPDRKRVRHRARTHLGSVGCGSFGAADPRPRTSRCAPPDLRVADADDDIGRRRVGKPGCWEIGRLTRPARANGLSAFCFHRLFCGGVCERPVGQHMHAGPWCRNARPLCMAT